MNKAFRNDAYAKVTGLAKYTDDFQMVGMLHAVPVYTEYVHAKIIAINTEKAQSQPGVVKIITAKDIPGRNAYGQIYQDYYMLASDKIRFQGDVVAVIVAETREQAIAAIPFVQVKVKELTPILDPVQAMKDKRHLVHESKGTNIINEHKIRRGDPANAFKECDKILEREYTTSTVEHAYLEPETALCYERGDGVMEVRGSMQHPFSTRRFVAAILGAELNNVEVVSVPMGGGFGGKDDTAAIVCARTALAARLCHAPVKMTYSREWSIRESYKRHPYILKYRVGLKNKKLHAVECRIIADGGAYTSVTPWVTWRSTVQCCGAYNVPNVHADVFGVHTNNPLTGAFRGFGSPQVNFAIEQLIEECAEEAGISPLEFRRINMLKQNSCTITGQKLNNHVVNTGKALELVLKESGYEKKLKKCTFGKGETLYGIGLALTYRGCSLGAEGMDFCSAIINAQFDGSVLLEVGIHENGQGAESAMILILAEHLGINKDRIRYRQSSTSQIPDGGTTVASRGTLMGGGAVVNAVKELKRIIAKALHKELDCKASEFSFHDDCVWGKDKKHFSWDEAVDRLHKKSIYPYAFGTFAAPRVDWEEETGRGKAYFTWVYGAEVAEVEIEKKTGNVKLLNVYAVHDVGKTINKALLEGQIYGGILQGAGMALRESLDIRDY
jgi:CO/xanthine dehydrogenase Mo-binding subunit